MVRDRGRLVHRGTCWRYIDDAVRLLERRSAVTLTVTEGQLYLDVNGTTLSSALHRRSAR